MCTNKKVVDNSRIIARCPKIELSLSAVKCSFNTKVQKFTAQLVFTSISYYKAFSSICYKIYNTDFLYSWISNVL